eukprot:1880045-Pleurochrysis_carterae.AAC.2
MGPSTVRDAPICSRDASVHMPQCAWYNGSLTIAARAGFLVAAMSLLEQASTCLRVSMLSGHSAAMPRLLVPAYDWWSEAAHGVAWAGPSTVFPCSLALASTFDAELLQDVGQAIGMEALAKHADHVARHPEATGDAFFGLTFFAPNINIVRDIRWGRAQETYGEDPALTSDMAAAFIRGLQWPLEARASGQSPRCLEASTMLPVSTRPRAICATAKHFAVYNLESNFAVGGVEPQFRLSYDAIVTNADLWQTFLPAFEAAVDANVGALSG